MRTKTTEQLIRLEDLGKLTFPKDFIGGESVEPDDGQNDEAPVMEKKDEETNSGTSNRDGKD